MTTDSFVLSHPGTHKGDRTDNPPAEELSGRAGAHPRHPHSFPTRRSARHLIRLLLSSNDRQSATDHLRILGPGGGPMAALKLL